MATLSPRIASELAELAYQVRETNPEGHYRLATVGMDAVKHFTFDLSNGPIRGISGGFLVSSRNPPALLWLVKAKILCSKMIM